VNVRLSALGDILHALPAVAALRRAAPGARIDWLVEDRFASLLEGHPAVDGLLVWPRGRWRRALRRPWAWPGLVVGVGRLLGRMWAARADCAIDLQGNLKSGIATLSTGAPVRIGLRAPEAREGNAFATNLHVRSRGTVHRTDRALALVGAALGRHPLVAEPAPLPRGEADRRWVDEALAAAGLPLRGYVVLHPGTSRFGAFKRWPADRFGRLSRRLAGDGPRTVVTVGPGEEFLGREVASAAQGTAVVLAPPSLRALAELVGRARVFVAADTGPLHIAAGEGVPVVALFGPKDAATYGPAAGRAPTVVVERADVPCRPCTLRRCPDPVCMTSIWVDDVEAAVARAVDAARASGAARRAQQALPEPREGS
jgi:heptosyltransferase-1